MLPVVVRSLSSTPTAPIDINMSLYLLQLARHDSTCKSTILVVFSTLLPPALFGIESIQVVRPVKLDSLTCRGPLNLRHGLGCRISAMLDEELCNVNTAILGRPMQGGQPVLVLGCHVGTMLDEEPCDIDVSFI